MDSILQGLTALYAECQNRGAATMGALLTIMIEGAKYMDTLWTVERREYSSLRDRVKDLEAATTASASASADAIAPIPNEPSDADLTTASADLGSNGGLAGQFASSLLVPNAANSTGIGAAGTLTFLNQATGDRQLVRSHTLSFNVSGTITSGSAYAPVKMGSVSFGPRYFTRVPKVNLESLNSDASGALIFVVPSTSGYDVWNGGGTIATAKSYQYAVTVTPN